MTGRDYMSHERETDDTCFIYDKPRIKTADSLGENTGLQKEF